MDQAEQDRETARRYEEAKASRNDPVDHEMHILQTTYKQLAQLDSKAKTRVMAYLNAVMGERLN